MTNILACTDGSIYASSVYNHTAWAAAKMSASVHVLHMLNPHHEDPVKADTSGSIGLGAKSALLAEIVELEAARAKVARKHGEVILEDAMTQLRAAGVEQIVADQKHGRLSDSIDNYERDADLVVIGKRGNHADFAAGHIGHNLERVVRSCQHPVLVASREFSKMERFILAFDGGSSSKKAVQYAANNPLLQGMKCHLLSIGKGSDKLKAALDEAKRSLSEAGFDVSAEIRDGEPDKVIGEAVAEDHIDLLVMGAYGHSHIRHLIVGSTTTAMIRTVQIPVLLFR
ncbi:MAG TPA: universal stress protein UspA [Opitutae bacterium]|nr:universal stress protein UspA [Opitutae bacterium]HBR66736.1 universal stress protein UspA [Opitutae bacterium]